MVAYVQGQNADLTVLAQQLQDKLPEYMQPSAWMSVEQFATTTHGKIDRQRLPAPKWQALVTADEQMALSDIVQQVIAEVWSELLQTPIDSAQAHFMRSGGHSLKLIQLAAQINQTFELSVTLSALLERPVLAEQCRYLMQLAQSEQRDLVAELSEMID